MCDAHQFISTNCLFFAEIIGIVSEWVSAAAMAGRRAWQLCSSLIVTWRITSQISIFINYDWTAEKNMAHTLASQQQRRTERRLPHFFVLNSNGFFMAEGKYVHEISGPHINCCRLVCFPSLQRRKYWIVFGKGTTFNIAAELFTRCQHTRQPVRLFNAPEK